MRTGRRGTWTIAFSKASSALNRTGSDAVGNRFEFRGSLCVNIVTRMPMWLAAAVTGDTMALNVEATEFLDVEVDHLTRGGSLVADHLRLRVEVSQLAQAQPTQHRAYRRDRHPRRRCDPESRHPLSAQPLDLGHLQLRRLAWTPPRGRAAVVMPSCIPQPMPSAPLVRGRYRDAGGLRRCLNRPALIHPLGHQGSTRRRQSGILTYVHPRSSAGSGVLQLQLRSSASSGEQPS